MSTYPQSGVKRPKIREGRVSDSAEYFHGIEKLDYNSSASPSDLSAYRQYSAAERVHQRTMDEWIKCSLSFTEFRKYGNERTEKASPSRPWDDGSYSVDNCKRCLKAFFELCHILGIRYWTSFDSDLVPWCESVEEYRSNWDEVLENIQEMSQRYHVKLLCMSPDLHSHPKYTSGALTNNEANTFIQAAYQIKKCLEMSQRLAAECFLLCPSREGYENICLTDVAKEIKLYAKMLKLTVDYKDRLNYRCQLLIMPYYCGNTGYNCGSKVGSLMWQHSRWRENDMNSYMWDVTSCLYLLKHYNLERYYKVCTPPGHHMYMANVYHTLGGVFITNEINHCDVKTMTLMMKCIVDQGTIPAAGIGLRLSPRRDSDLRELVCGYAKYVDGVARGLRAACGMNTRQIFSKHTQQRYSSYNSGVGSRALNADLSADECEDYYKKNQCEHSDVACKSEQFDIAFQRYLDTLDHI